AKARPKHLTRLCVFAIFASLRELLLCRLESNEPGSGIERYLKWEQCAASEDEWCPWRDSRQHICRHFIQNERANAHRLWRDSTRLNGSTTKIMSDAVIGSGD